MSDMRTPAKPATGLISRMKGRGGRGDRSALGMWFWDIDRVLLLLTMLLIAIGLVAVGAASPSAARCPIATSVGARQRSAAWSVRTRLCSSGI